MNRTIHTLSFFIIIILNTNCQDIKNPNDSSPKTSKQESENFNAFNKELIIPIEGDSVAGYALIANGEAPKETIILIQGYPGNDTNFDIGQEIRKNGQNVILFNHRGAWGSQGIYSYLNCLEDIEELIKYLAQNEISKKLRIKKNDFTLIGRSYGAGIALIQGSQIQNVKKIIAISSVNYGNLMKRYNSINELENYKRYMQKQIMMNHNIDNFLQELLDNKNELDIVNYSDKLKNKKVLLIEDSNKNENWISQLKNCTYLNIDSDHNFINERNKLISIILNWIKNQE